MFGIKHGRKAFKDTLGNYSIYNTKLKRIVASGKSKEWVQEAIIDPFTSKKAPFLKIIKMKRVV